MSHKILIVDDEPANLRVLERIFRHSYNVITAASGVEALGLLEQQDFALIVTDQRMPGMTGIELLKRTANLRPHMVRIILTGYTDVEALVDAINCGQVYKYISKPWVNDDLKLTVERAIEHYETNKARHELTLTNQRLVSRMKEMTRNFVRSIADALEAKDEYILGHARRVSGYAAVIGGRMGLDEGALEQLSLASFLHDIGYIGTPDYIISKPGPLTDEERAIMRLHPKRGARILSGIADMEEVAVAVLHHHEHFDGTGYPNFLRGEQIPLMSRIIHVADAYDAMTSPRPFRETYLHDAALAQLEKGAGKQFDPEVISAFRSVETLARIRQAVADGISAFRLSRTAPAAQASGLTLGEMIEEVETEPLLAASVLREANAECPESPTAKLLLACSRLGENRLREILARATPGLDGIADKEPLWERSLRAAEAARLLAEKNGVINPEDAYTLGLLHDVGEILLQQLFPDEVKNIRSAASGDRLEREIAAFGVDHAQVGQWVLESCGVPRALAAVIQTHHDVARINSPGALLLHLAETIASAENPYQVAALDTIDIERIYMLGLSRNDLFRIHACIDTILERKLMSV